jgi:2-oxoisovalerate dehydrogenase E1 component
MDTPIPFNLELEKQYLANARLDEMMQKLLAY